MYHIAQYYHFRLYNYQHPHWQYSPTFMQSYYYNHLNYIEIYHHKAKRYQISAITSLT
jgi:hypothetical protein